MVWQRTSLSQRLLLFIVWMLIPSCETLVNDCLTSVNESSLYCSKLVYIAVLEVTTITLRQAYIAFVYSVH